MLVCSKCKKEMICERNGVVAVWNGNHCYVGDQYKCTVCGNQTLVTNPSPYYNPDVLKTTNREYLLVMDEEN